MIFKHCKSSPTAKIRKVTAPCLAVISSSDRFIGSDGGGAIILSYWELGDRSLSYSANGWDREGDRLNLWLRNLNRILRN